MNSYVITYPDTEQEAMILDADGRTMQAVVEQRMVERGDLNPAEGEELQWDEGVRPGSWRVNVMSRHGDYTDRYTMVQREDDFAIANSGVQPSEMLHYFASPTNATKVIRYERGAAGHYTLLCRVSGGAKWATHVADERGAYYGHYFNTFFEALADYNKRIAR